MSNINTRATEKELTQLFIRHFKYWFKHMGLVRLVNDKYTQFRGIDMFVGLMAIDIKFHRYPGLYFFLEMYNMQHQAHENSYIKGRKDGKDTDFILYICLEQGKAFLIDYNKVHEMALKVEQWHKSSRFNTLTEVAINGKANGTLGMTIPIETLEPIETYSFQTPKNIKLEPHNVAGFLDKYEEFADWLESDSKNNKK